MGDVKIGSMIQKYMKINNMTMKEVGKKVGRGESTVSMWISGKNTPRMGQIQELANLFNISVEELIYGDNKENDKGIDFMLSKELMNLTDKEKQDVVDYINFIKSKR